MKTKVLKKKHLYIRVYNDVIVKVSLSHMQTDMIVESSFILLSILDISSNYEK
jgi:hypothetical protein